MDPTQQQHFIKALFVFENTMNRVPVFVACDLAELVRSLHVYGLNDGKEKQVEREFLFKERGSYVEMQATSILKLRGFQVSELFQGRAIGLWLCIFAFGAQSSLAFVDIPPKLLISRLYHLKHLFFNGFSSSNNGGKGCGRGGK
ncbi:hypothetical protein WN944_015906 [Citrus x changshan-huyou]|uniref:Uncharacterized protein n=1 Tax=Citrus x changshan-huyou TaxID=2935761 RepID=A0AAP0M8D7_9ROSI